MKKLIVSMCAMCFLVAPSVAQVEPIQTDRPDQTESTALTPVGFVQAEHGVAFEKEGGVSLIAHPSTLFKYGISDRWEFRWVVEPVTMSSQGAPTTRGILPMEFGTKVYIWEEDDGSSALSLIAHLQMPHLASSAFRGTRVAPLARFTWFTDLGGDWRFAMNGGMEWDAGGGPASAIYTAAIGSSITESLGWYGELYGFLPVETFPADHRVNGGVAYLINEDVQLDAALGVGLTSDPAPWFVGVGVSYRFAIVR